MATLACPTARAEEPVTQRKNRADKPGRQDTPAVAKPDEIPEVHIPLAREFLGVDIVDVLVALAKESNVELVVSEDLKGTITIRLEDKTPLETIKIICQQKGLPCCPSTRKPMS